MLQSGGEEEKEGHVCVCGTAARHGTVAGRQLKDSSMNKKGAYLPPPLSLFFHQHGHAVATQITPAHTLTPSPSLILSLLLAWHRWNPC